LLFKFDLNTFFGICLAFNFLLANVFFTFIEYALKPIYAQSNKLNLAQCSTYLNMKKLLDYLFSMQLAAILLLVLAFSMASATFLENDFGTPGAQQMVYRATWFEVLMILFCINLIGSIFRKRMLQRKKYGAFLFHFAMVIILFGSGVTRFVGYEGTMFIREGQSSNLVYTENPYLQIKAIDGEKIYFISEQKTFSPYANNRFHKTYDFNGKELDFRVKEFVPNAIQIAEEDPNGSPILSLVVSASSGRQNILLKAGEEIDMEMYRLTFDMPDADSNKINLITKDGQLFFVSPYPTYTLSMMDQSKDTLAAREQHPFTQMKLFTFDRLNVVLKTYYPKAILKLVPGDASAQASNALVVEMSSGGKSRTINIDGGKGVVGKETPLVLDGINYLISYGALPIELPFRLQLIDFQLERYPGSNSPSSYASEVMLIDENNGINEPRRIFMNNVLNYGGFRFFQSSYDKDEKGTILSVNHDYWGTLFSYLGYFLLTLGMVISFLERNSRFRYLVKSTSNKAKPVITLLLIILGSFAFLMPQQTYAQEKAPKLAMQQIVDKVHAEEFGKLLVQDNDGRIEPINTLASELLRKISKKDKFEGQTPEQVLLGMMINPMKWQAVPMIKISNDKVAEVLSVDGKYAAFNDFIDFEKGGVYKLQNFVEEAYQKKPSERSKFDNEIIKADERLNISFLVYKQSMMRLFPVPDDPNNKWITSADAPNFLEGEPGSFVSNIFSWYADSVRVAMATQDWDPANKTLAYIFTFQNRFGAKVLPSATKVKLEVAYNKANIFKRLFQVYGLIGFIMLILLFINILNPKLRFRIALIIMQWILVLGFILQTSGLALRWYISGHAPWSNGYESMIYIAWATLLAGLIFTKRSKIALATTAILASVILMVAHLSWMDPQITNLVPVLKSYWLVIHVAIITASYSFLGLGALMGFFNLLIMISKTKKNFSSLNVKIKELSYIIEMALIIGTIMLSIGTFLGGIWANESWGRYWGWDPKETWALITILVYSFVLHMRLIPGLKSTYGFNLAALLGFGSVLMTYFGVNYYLSGLHSYAQGDPVPIPMFVYYTIGVIFITAVLAYIKNNRFSKPEYY
jgi:cytochrome c-type biogenesis protein CcsB